MRFRITLAMLLILVCPAFAQKPRILRFPNIDGNSVIFSYMGDLWTVNEDGSNPRRLTSHPGRDLVPRFSPDGKHIAFSSNRHGGYDVFVMPAEGGEPKRLTVHSGSDFVAGWTPDGRNIIFVSGRVAHFGSRLYKVSIDGGMPQDMGLGASRRGTYSPDGTRMAFNKRGFRTWRKKYRGSANTDIWIADFKTGGFTRLTNFDGQDAWPMWAGEDEIYFASDRDGAMNLWKISPSGGEPVQVTKYQYPGIKYPTISWDRKKIVYEHNSGLWKFDITTAQASEIIFDLPVDQPSNQNIWMSFNNYMTDFSTTASAQDLAFSVRGEVFTIPTGGGDTRRITTSEAKDQLPVYSPDGSKLAYISDKDGDEKLYIYDIEKDETEKAGTTGNIHYNIMWTWGGILSWSPDGKKIIYGADSKLCIYDVDEKTTTVEIDGPRGTIIQPVWSPDGRWIAYTKRNSELQFNIFATNLETGIEYQLTDEPTGDFSPEFTLDGKGLLFSSERSGRYQVHYIAFDKRPYDFSDPEERRAEAERKKEEEEAKKAGDDPHGKGIEDIVITDLTETDAEKAETEKPEEVSSAQKVIIRMEGLRERTIQITNLQGYLEIGPVARNDGTSFLITSRETRGNSAVDVLYTATVNVTGKPQADIRPLAEGGNIRALDYASQADVVFFQDGNTLKFMPAKGGPQTPLGYSVKTEVDQRAEREQIFNEVWRALRDGFYDEKMHGTDWEAIRQSYHALLDNVVDKGDLEYLIDEMLGELNASHMGYYTPGTSPDAESRYLGIEFETNSPEGLYRVSYIYPEGPADKDFVDLDVGDYIYEIDGNPVTNSDNLYEYLTSPMNSKVNLLVAANPDGEDQRTVRIQHIGWNEYWALFYTNWVTKNREYVEKKTSGRIGYLHISSMSGPALERFRRDLVLNSGREALIIDVRYNGGGNIEQQLLDILERRRYQYWIPRDIGEQYRPHEGFFGPKAVLINETSASNAEMFPAGFRQLGLGKVIGVTTTGAVIGTTSYTLIDGSTVRMPQVGVSLIDGTNMENFGVPPDIFVEYRPEDELAGKDPQLDAAIEELMKELRAPGAGE